MSKNHHSDRPTLRQLADGLRIDLSTREGRLNLALAMSRSIPGAFGARLRKRILYNHLAAIGPGVIIYRGVEIRNIHRVSLGKNVQLGQNVFLQAGGGLSIGDDTLLGPGVKIWTQNHRIEDPHTPIAEQGADYQAVSIGPDCWLGANSFILPGVTLPRGCVVAAGSVVGVRPYKEYQILMGYPARPIGSRLPSNAGPDDPDSP